MLEQPKLENGRFSAKVEKGGPYCAIRTVCYPIRLRESRLYQLSCNNYQLLHQYHKILAACNIYGKELASSPLILHKANTKLVLLKYCTQPIFCGIDEITVLSYG